MGFYRFINYITQDVLGSKKLKIAFFLIGSFVFVLESVAPPWGKEDYHPRWVLK